MQPFKERTPSTFMDTKTRAWCEQQKYTPVGVYVYGERFTGTHMLPSVAGLGRRGSGDLHMCISFSLRYSFKFFSVLSMDLRHNFKCFRKKSVNKLYFKRRQNILNDVNISSLTTHHAFGFSEMSFRICWFRSHHKLIL